MPQIETWSRLPPVLRGRRVERMRDRNVSLDDLNQLCLWIESKPEVPEGQWYKDFGSFKLFRGRAISEDVSSRRPARRGEKL
jgi:hypothetical protein